MKQLLLLSFLFFSFNTFSQTTFIPDDNFEIELQSLGLDSGPLDNYVNTANIVNVDTLLLNWDDITDLTGIEDFTSLVSLSINHNDIDSLDFSANTNLKTLSCAQSNVEYLILNAGLKKLYCQENNLTSLVASDSLQDLSCQYNDLISLTLNPQLEILHCYDNKITSLDIKNSPLLTRIDCENNEITSIQTAITNNTNLIHLSCQYNPLSSLDVTHYTALEILHSYYTHVPSLDLTKNTALTSLWCQSDSLYELDLRNGNNANMHHNNINVTGKMTCIFVDNATEAAGYYWTKSSLTSFVESDIHCDAIQIYIPDDNFEQYLIEQGVDNRMDNYVPMVYLQTYTTLDISGKNIAELTGIHGFEAMTILHAENNQITSVDLNGNNMLRELYINNNNLSELDVTGNGQLRRLYCQDNELFFLNVQNGNQQVLTQFDARNNPDLSCIKVDNPDDPNLQFWHIDEEVVFADSDDACENIVGDKTYVPDDNFEQKLIDLGYDSGALDNYVPTENISGVTELNLNFKSIADLTGLEDFTALQLFYCYGNQISTVDFSTNTALLSVYLDDNQIQEIDLHANTNLLVLQINNNQLTAINVRNSPNLSTFECSNNHLTRLDMSQNSKLNSFNCKDNLLSFLDMRNGNNANLSNTFFQAQGNPNLSCIVVDDANYSTTTWININDNVSFSETELGCGISGQKTYVPDDAFEQALIDLGFDTGELDDSVYTQNISNIQSLDIHNKGITLMIGIEDFAALQTLTCTDNQIVGLYLSLNSNLTSLSCGNNNMRALDVRNGNNAAMQFFDAVNNPLLKCIFVEEKDASYLGLWYKDLSSTWVNTIPECEVLYEKTYIPDDNFEQAIIDLQLDLGPLDDSIYTAIAVEILALDLTDKNIADMTGIEAFTKLQSLKISNNQISSIDLSHQTDLKLLEVNNNQLANLDLSDCAKMEALSCMSNDLTSLDMRSGENYNISAFNASQNPNLKCIFVDNPPDEFLANWQKDYNSSFVADETQCETVATKDLYQGIEFSIFPNPASDEFHIQLDAKIESLKIFDVFGKLINSFPNQKTYSSTNLRAGLYLIEVKTKEGIGVRKLIVE